MRLKQERNQIIRNEEKGRLRNHWSPVEKAAKAGIHE